MTRWQQIEKIYQSVVELPENERLAFLVDYRRIRLYKLKAGILGSALKY